MLQTIGRENLKRTKESQVEHNKTWAVAQKRKQLQDAIDSYADGDKKPKPNLIVNRDKQKVVVLKWSKHYIEGFPLGKAPTRKKQIETLKEIRDIWLEKPESQELIWQVHQEMKAELRKARGLN